MAAANSNYDVILTSTLEAYRKTFTDNVFIDLPLTNFLTSRDRMRMDQGAKILEPLMTSQNSTAGSYSGYDTLSLTAQEGLDTAEYAWKQLYATIAINGLEEGQNQEGDTRIINLLNAKIKQAEMSVKDYMNSMLFADGTGNSSKDWNGLANLIDSTGTVGNIAYSAFTDWASTETPGSTRSDDTWTTAYNAVSNGTDRPDALFTTQTLWESYESGLVPQLRYTSNSEADGRFQNLLFKGAPVFWDRDCTSGVTYFVNSKYIGIVGMNGKWFTNTPFVKPSDKDARYSQILVYGNLVVNNRARHGKITGQTA